MSQANILHSSNSQEWFTPPKYVEAVRLVFGMPIGLDPASCREANKIVLANRYFTNADDGLSQVWKAWNVFLNPPYGKTNNRSNQEIWSEKMLAEYQAGHFFEGIMLVNATTDRKWFGKLWQYPICFTDHRIRFYSPTGIGNAPTHGNAFVYLGKNNEKFTKVFRKFGTVVQALKSGV